MGEMRREKMSFIVSFFVNNYDVGTTGLKIINKNINKFTGQCHSIYSNCNLFLNNIL